PPRGREGAQATPSGSWAYASTASASCARCVAGAATATRARTTTAANGGRRIRGSRRWARADPACPLIYRLWVYVRKVRRTDTTWTGRLHVAVPRRHRRRSTRRPSRRALPDRQKRRRGRRLRQPLRFLV